MSNAWSGQLARGMVERKFKRLEEQNKLTKRFFKDELPNLVSCILNEQYNRTKEWKPSIWLSGMMALVSLVQATNCISANEVQDIINSEYNKWHLEHGITRREDCVDDLSDFVDPYRESWGAVYDK